MLLPNDISCYGSKAAVFTTVMWRVVEGEGEQEGESGGNRCVCGYDSLVYTGGVCERVGMQFTL